MREAINRIDESFLNIADEQSCAGLIQSSGSHSSGHRVDSFEVTIIKLERKNILDFSLAGPERKEKNVEKKIKFDAFKFFPRSFVPPQSTILTF